MPRARGVGNWTIPSSTRREESERSLAGSQRQWHVLVGPSPFVSGSCLFHDLGDAPMPGDRPRRVAPP